METFDICVVYTAKSAELAKLFVDEIISAGILDLIKNEDGCLTYEYYFSATNEKKIVLFERWRDKNCQKVHMMQPHMKDLSEIKAKYIDNVQIKQIKLM